MGNKRFRTQALLFGITAITESYVDVDVKDEVDDDDDIDEPSDYVRETIARLNKVISDLEDYQDKKEESALEPDTYDDQNQDNKDVIMADDLDIELEFGQDFHPEGMIDLEDQRAKVAESSNNPCKTFQLRNQGKFF